jgi:Spy/CpxP family protein refolding chaperone
VSAKTLTYLVVILMVVNIAALGTILYERATRPEPIPGWDPAVRPPWRETHDADRQAHSWRELRRLNLTEDQRRHLHESRQELMTSVADLHDSVQSLRIDLLERMSDQKPDSTAVFSMVTEIGDLQTEIQRRVAAHILRDGDILEPQQRRLLIRMLQRFGQDNNGFDPGTRRGRNRGR